MFFFLRPGVHVIIVAHPTKAWRRETNAIELPFGQTDVVAIHIRLVIQYDLNGSVMLSNIAIVKS